MPSILLLRQTPIVQRKTWQFALSQPTGSGHRYLFFLGKNRQMMASETISRQSSFYYVQWQVFVNSVISQDQVAAVPEIFYPGQINFNI
jgi:hypothetical protein